MLAKLKQQLVTLEVPVISKTALISLWPFLAVFTAEFIWGINFVVAKLTLTIIPPMSLAFLRFFLATLFLLPFVLTNHENTKIRKKDLPMLLFVGVLIITLNIALFYFGIAKTTATDASIISLIVPILSIFTGWTILKEKIYTVNLIGIILGLFGGVFILGVPSLLTGSTVSSEHILGNILILFSSISWVVGATFSRQLLKRYDTFTLTFIIFMVGAITFLVPALGEYLQNPEWLQHVTLMGLIGLLYITLLSSVSAFFLFEWGLGKIGIIKADLFGYLSPLIATTMGVIILNEQLHYAFIIGGVMIGLGVYWGTLGKPHHKIHKGHHS